MIAVPKVAQAPMLVCPKCGSTYTRSLEFCGLDGERLTETETDPLVGRTIDRYKIVAPIGSGGMARVYRATHVFLEQDFAMKVLFGQIASDKSFTKRFHREATTLGKIKHRNVVSVSDFGATKEGLLFLVMEYLDGPSLTQVIKGSAPFPPARAASIARQLALGLGAAHSRGFVHRDLKPGNVIVLEEDGLEVPKILDFGLVRMMEQELGRIPTQLTAHGQMFGTPAYMSPEQIGGEDVDSRSDLYSLGVILYQMIVGTPPFIGEVGDLVRQHMSSPPPQPVLEYGGLTPLALRLLEKHPGDRPQSAADVVEAIDRLGLVAAPITQRPKKRSDSARAFETIDLRTERTPQREDLESQEIRRRAQDALGFRAHWRPVLFIGMVAVVFFMLWVADQQGLLRRPAPASGPIALAEPPPPPVEPPKPAEPPPPPAVEPKKAPAKAKAPPKRSPPPPSPPPTRRPPPEPEPDPVDDGRPLAFNDLDSSLGWMLSSRGLAWEDIAEVETEAAWRWSRWYKGTHAPSQAELKQTYDRLFAAARGLEIDRDLLADKLARARIALSRVPEDLRDARYDVLVKRADELTSAIRAPVLRAPVERIAAQITLLESDAAAAGTSPRRVETSTRGD